MSDSESKRERSKQMETERKNGELKHLGIVRAAAIHTLVWVTNLYEYAKQNSGPLKSTVGTVEGAASAVVGPVYERFKGVPQNLLLFLDEKVGEATKKFDEKAPPAAKKAAKRANSMIRTASEGAQKLVNKAQTEGPWAAFQYAGAQYKQFLFTQTMKTWVLIDQVSTFHKVTNVAVPVAHRWSVKYNYVIQEMSARGYPVFKYLPLVPVDEIAKTYKQCQVEEKEDAPTKDESSSDSD